MKPELPRKNSLPSTDNSTGEPPEKPESGDLEQLKVQFKILKKYLKENSGEMTGDSVKTKTPIRLRIQRAREIDKGEENESK
jgi:hypothetical protein